MEMTATLTLTEAELKGLEKLGQWGVDALVDFLVEFSKKFGKVSPEEQAGLASFFKATREHIPGFLERARDARAAFNGRKHPTQEDD